jgi:general secretion pathway protein G
MVNTEKGFRRGCAPKATAITVSEHGGTALDNSGFTLLELVLVCAILGILAALAIPSYTHMINTAKISRCEEEIRGIEKSIGAFQADRGVLPDDLNAVGQGNLLDPWGHPYQYYNIAKGGGTQYQGHFGNDLNSGTGYDLYSLGADGQTSFQVPAPGATNLSSDDVVRASDGAYVGLASAL